MANDERCTPRWLYDLVDEAYRFDIDLAATNENALCDVYFTKENNALAQGWDDTIAWCNPPYSRGQLVKWVTKALESPNATILMLLPGDCSTKAGQLALSNSSGVLFLDRRLSFDNEPQGAKFASWLVLFNGDIRDRRKLYGLDLGVVL